MPEQTVPTAQSSRKPKVATRPKEAHPLDVLAKADPRRVIALMLWKERFRNPDLYVQIDEKDIKGFDDCVQYLKVEPEIVIARPAGLPATPAIPATHNRRAIQAREATPPKPFVIVKLVAAGTDNRIVPVENNQEDYDKAQHAARLRKAKDQAQMLANRLVDAARSGESSLSDIQDAAEALILLAGAV